MTAKQFGSFWLFVVVFNKYRQCICDGLTIEHCPKF